MLCSGEHESIAEHAQEIGCHLYPLGELHDEYLYKYAAKIIIDDIGQVFIGVFWATIYLGATFNSALDNMIAGAEGKIANQNGD